jgi:hypothetical protein
MMSNDDLDKDINKLRMRSKIELSSSENLLVLGDIELGPIALPGPSKVVFDQQGDRVLIKYSSGWPGLNFGPLGDEVNAPKFPYSVMSARKASSLDMVISINF